MNTQEVRSRLLAVWGEQAARVVQVVQGVDIHLDECFWIFLARNDGQPPFICECDGPFIASMRAEESWDVLWIAVDAPIG